MSTKNQVKKQPKKPGSKVKALPVTLVESKDPYFSHELVSVEKLDVCPVCHGKGSIECEDSGRIGTKLCIVCGGKKVVAA